VIENRKGYSCWTKDDPGCGFVVWKVKAGKTLSPAIVKELMATRRTAQAVRGFRGRSGRTFSAKLKLEQVPETGKWRVEFDEDWAREPREPEDGAAAEAAANGAGSEGAATDAAKPRRAAGRSGSRRREGVSSGRRGTLNPG
jgi:DNA topoisomerase-3